jgi:23S rRNA (cytosine1962-C5)-methyltransferase
VYRKMLRPPRVSVPNGAYLALRDRDGALVGRGFLNRRSQIAFRIVADPADPTDPRRLFDLRLGQALALRTEVLGIANHTDCYRLVHGEGDRLSGLVIDRYGKTAVVSVYALAYVAHAEQLEAALRSLQGIERVIFQADARSEQLEHFQLPPLPCGLEETVREGRVRYRVDLSSGHKTGLFLDQRDNRHRIAGLAAGRRVLDLCTNAGGFALSAAVSGRARRVIGVDLDEDALARARDNARLNRARIDWKHADLFPFLRERSAARDGFDVVILDPPKLARTRSEVEAALRRYRQMNALAMAVVAPRSLLATFSCSGSVSEEAFLHMLAAASREAGRRARVIAYLGAAPDHPVSLEFPEGRYLKGALLQVE